MDREIPIILDDLADPEFGTGVVKVTPAHDPNDFEAGRRHNLPKIQVIDDRGNMTAAAGPYAGLDRFEARSRVVADLESRGDLVKTEDYPLSLGKCQRCKTVVEPLVSTQWFVKTKPLAEKAIAAVESGRIGFIPAQLGQDLLRVDVQHPRLVHLAPALVGPSHSRLALPRMPRNRGGARSAHHLPALRLHRPGAGSRRARHLVQLRPLAVLHARLARPDRRPGHLLPHFAAHHRLRHPLLLGGPHGHAGHRIHGRRALPPGLHPRPGARRRAAEDVEDHAATSSTRWWSPKNTAPTPCAWRCCRAPRPAPISSSPKSAWKARAPSPTRSGTPPASSSSTWSAPRVEPWVPESLGAVPAARRARHARSAHRGPLDLQPPQHAPSR